MHKTKSKNRFIAYLNNFFQTWVSSFKEINIQLLFVIILDLVFLALSYLAIYASSQILTQQALMLQGISMDSLELQQTEAAVTSFNHFLYSLLILLIAFIIFMLLNWSFSRYCIWNLILHGRIQLKKFWKFVLANFIWFLIWLVPLIFALYPIFVMVKLKMQLEKPPLFPLIALGIIIVAILHFTYLYFIGFIREQKIGKALAFAFKAGTVKIRFLLLPYLIMIVGFVILSIISYPLKFASDKVSIAVSLILMLAYNSWIRFYLSKTVVAIK